MSSTNLESLTKEQEALIPILRNEWIRFCLGGNSEINRDMASKGLRWIYGLAKLDEPRVVFVDGPYACQIAVWFIKELAKRKKLPASVKDNVRNSVWTSVWNSVRDSVRDSVKDSVVDSVVDSVWNSVRDSVKDSVKDSVGDRVWNSVRDSVVNSVWASVRTSVGASVRDSVVDSVWDSVGASVWDSVKDSVGDSVVDSVWNSVRGSVRGSVRDSVVDSVVDSVWNSVGASVWDSVRDSVWGSGKKFDHYGWCDLGGDSGWTACMEYFERIGIKVHPNFAPYKELLRSGVFMSIYLKGFAIVCPRPSVVHKNSEGRLHKDLAPAIQWKGEDYFFLNGVRMKKEQVLKSAEKIDVQEVVKEKNAEVRRELIRKIGVERFIKKAGAKVLDKQGDYELLSVRLSAEVPDARYLKMLNPSIGVWHVEGVEGNTVSEAIDFRAGRVISKGEKWEPSRLS